MEGPPSPCDSPHCAATRRIAPRLDCLKIARGILIERGLAHDRLRRANNTMADERSSLSWADRYPQLQTAGCRIPKEGVTKFGVRGFNQADCFQKIAVFFAADSGAFLR